MSKDIAILFIETSGGQTTAPSGWYEVKGSRWYRLKARLLRRRPRLTVYYRQVDS